MIGTVYFKDGHTENIVTETFVRSGTESLYFRTDYGNQYHIKVAAEIVDMDKDEWKIGSRLLFFKRRDGDGYWSLTDEIEKVGIKLEDKEEV